jgi:hypothetical protein
MAEEIHTQAIGSPGLAVWSGRIDDEPLKELSGNRWLKVVREMMDQDDVVGACLFAIEMLVRQAAWDVRPASDDAADHEVAEFVEECMDDMQLSWANQLGEISTMFPFGWAYFETLYKQRKGEVRRQDGSVDYLRSSKHDDGKIGWAAWSPRSQETCDGWAFDEDGCITGMYQVAPPAYQRVLIPIDRALHFMTSSRKNNPQGHSVLRAAYRPWYFKKHIQNIEGIGIERDLAGLAVAAIPASVISAGGAVYEAWKQTMRNVRRNEQEGLIVPSDRYPDGSLQYEVKLLSTGGQRQFNTDVVISRYNTGIAMTVLADFILLGHQAVGSFALSSDKTDLFSIALGAWLDSICEVVNGRAIPALLKLNGIDMEHAPELVHGDVRKVSLQELGTYIGALSGAGITFDPQQIEYLLEQAKIPAPEDDAQEAPPVDELPDSSGKQLPSDTAALLAARMFSYDLEQGIVDKNERREVLGFAPKDTTLDDKFALLRAKIAIVKQAIDAQIPLSEALKMAELDLDVEENKSQGGGGA